MTKITPYALYLNTLRALKRDQNDVDFEGCDELLAYLLEAAQNDRIVSMNDLVYTRDFGTSPTIQRKIKALQSRGFVDILRTPSDKRAKIVHISAKGVDHLEKQTLFMQQIFNGQKNT